MRGRLVVPLLGVAALAAVAIRWGKGPETAPAPGKQHVRLAYFPNLTHAAALVGMGRGEFEKALPAGVALAPRVFNAGPEEMEALLAGEVDVGYVGPSPALNTYVKSGGRALRIVAGASSGGAALVARCGAAVSAAGDLDGRRVAVPQLGGTQDVSLRHFLARSGLRPREQGGTVEVVPLRNPDILALMRRAELDAAWVPEPWAARLIAEAGARLVVDERALWPGGRFTTTVVVARTAYLREHPQVVAALVTAHVRSVQWLRAHPEGARRLANAELKRLTGKELPEEVLEQAWARVEFTDDPYRESIRQFVAMAQEAGYLPRTVPGAAALFEPAVLEQARRAAVGGPR